MATCVCSILVSHNRTGRSRGFRRCNRRLRRRRPWRMRATSAWSRERPDVRDDIFSFSCITYELLERKASIRPMLRAQSSQRGLQGAPHQGLVAPPMARSEERVGMGAGRSPREHAGAAARPGPAIERTGANSAPPDGVATGRRCRTAHTRHRRGIELGPVTERSAGKPRGARRFSRTSIDAEGQWRAQVGRHADDSTGLRCAGPDEGRSGSSDTRSRGAGPCAAE